MPWPHVLKYYILLQNPTISAMNSVMLLSVQFSRSVVSNFATPWNAACQASLSTTNCGSLLKLMSIKSWCHPTISSSVSPSLPAFNLYQHQGLFKWISSLHQVAKVFSFSWMSFSFSISPSNEYSGLISFRMDWLDLLAVQGTLKSLLQQHGSKALILWRLAFFIVQFSHPYMTTGKIIALTRWTFVSKVMPLLLNMLS